MPITLLPFWRVGEVKEGAPRFNSATRDPEVLGVALARFGCCDRGQGPELARRLLARGQVDTPSGHTVRMVAFGTAAASDEATYRWHAVSMHHVAEFLRSYLRDHWEVLKHGQISDPALGVLALLEKWGAEATRRSGS